MNMTYSRIIIFIGFIFSFIIIWSGWIITREIANLRNNLGTSTTDYMQSVFLHTITYGNVVMVSGIVLIILLLILIVIAEKRN